MYHILKKFGCLPFLTHFLSSHLMISNLNYCIFFKAFNFLIVGFDSINLYNMFYFFFKKGKLIRCIQSRMDAFKQYWVFQPRQISVFWIFLEYQKTWTRLLPKSTTMIKPSGETHTPLGLSNSPGPFPYRNI